MDKKQITATVLLSIFTTIAGIGLWSGIVSTQQDINTKNIKGLQVDLASEREQRKDEFTEILVALSSLDTKVSILMENRNNDKD
jgi:hypothetical protein